MHRTTKNKQPELGKSYIINEKIFGFCTFNPFTQEEKSLGWLYINPITKNLQWTPIMSFDSYSMIGE